MPTNDDAAFFQAQKREWAEIERSVAKSGWRELESLVKAGFRRDKVLKLVAMAATDDKSWKKGVRKIRDEMKNLSTRLGKIAAESRKFAKSPAYRLETLEYLTIGGSALGFRPVAWKDDLGIQLMIAGMETWSGMLDKEAKLVGRLLNSAGRSHPTVVLLLVFLWLDKGKLPPLDKLARLLSDAFEACNKTSNYSADSLRKLFDRQGKRILCRAYGNFSRLAASRSANTNTGFKSFLGSFSKPAR
jgi:hypothetical protein